MTGRARALAARAVGGELGAYAASLVPPRPAARFLVLCTPRSGSELLVDLLDQVPGIRCEGEILSESVRRPARFLDGRARLATLRGARAWGGKVLAQHLLWYEARYGPAAGVLRGLVDDGWTLVHLRRANVLASALSALHAEQTGRFHDRRTALDGVEAPDRAHEPVDADVATILAWVHAYDAHLTWLDEVVADVPHLTVSYEDDLCDDEGRQRAVDRVAGALDLPSAPVRAGLRRGLPADPWDRVPDPAALEELLRLTRFAHLIRS